MTSEINPLSVLSMSHTHVSFFKGLVILATLCLLNCSPDTTNSTISSSGEQGNQAGTPFPGDELGGYENNGGEGGSGVVQETQQFIPAPATIYRLSTAERRASVKSIFGFVPITNFEQETTLHGSTRVANAELTISPQLTEQLETFAWEVAKLLQEDPSILFEHFPCPLSQNVDGQSVALACIRSSILELGRKLWRRPLEQSEMERLANLYETLRGELLTENAHYQAASGVVAAFLQAPDFAFRVDIGEPDPEQSNGQEPTIWRYTSMEMASRLSYFIWGTTPDDELRRAADEGLLLTDEGLQAQTIRLLDDPRASAHFTSYFDELMGLEFLETVSKNADLFPIFTDSLRTSMRAEINALFTMVVFERDTDFRELLTSNESSVDNELAELYGIPLSAPLSPGERSLVTLPVDQDRGGLLGRAAPLALFSHATVNSPTFRGRFIRSGLLCQDVPPPPEGVITELEEQDEGEVQTLRERLERHATDPQCAGCHKLMDPLGYPLERFDPVGQWREFDNGLEIDSSGEVDGILVNGAKELGQAVADSSYFSSCMTKRLYRYAVGHLENFDEYPLIDSLDDRFQVESAYRFKRLVLEVVMSDGFRRLSPQELTTDENGQEILIEGCGGTELCDGEDNDCDGRIDEGVVKACENSCGLQGVSQCSNAQWLSCDLGDLPPELCDGEDNDCDGEIDEDVLSIPERCDGEDNDCDGRVDEEVVSSIHDVPFTVLTNLHDGCRADQRNQSHCNAAISRYCQSLGCGGTGLGPIESAWQSLTVLCLPSNVVNIEQVSYIEMAARHDACDGQREALGPSCNAAIHRHCSQTGRQTGFGPVERPPNALVIACVPEASVLSVTYTELSTYHEDCNQSGERSGANCNAAINRLCGAQGFRSGWGPLENSGDLAVIACIN